jgi:hypothetical protein
VAHDLVNRPLSDVWAPRESSERNLRERSAEASGPVGVLLNQSLPLSVLVHVAASWLEVSTILRVLRQYIQG